MQLFGPAFSHISEVRTWKVSNWTLHLSITYAPNDVYVVHLLAPYTFWSSVNKKYIWHFFSDSNLFLLNTQWARMQKNDNSLGVDPRNSLHNKNLFNFQVILKPVIKYQNATKFYLLSYYNPWLQFTLVSFFFDDTFDVSLEIFRLIKMIWNNNFHWIQSTMLSK